MPSSRSPAQAEPACGPVGRYAEVDRRKAAGATYTPTELARFIAEHMVAAAGDRLNRSELTLLDPALGDGALALALLEALGGETAGRVVLRGFETDGQAAEVARRRISERFPEVGLDIQVGDFLRAHAAGSVPTSDLIIANPPYVRAQVIGAKAAQKLADRFGLTGRVDLYQAFLLAMVATLDEGGVLGAITSNRFLCTRGAAAFRRALLAQLEIRHLWDLGDTKPFDAAVLPALLVAVGRSETAGDGPARFTTIYQCAQPADSARGDVITSLDHEGVVRLPDGRYFRVRQGTLSYEHPGGVWRLSSPAIDDWRKRVTDHTPRLVGSLGKIRVGVKTTADEVFIRDDWEQQPADQIPELLLPLITHHGAARYCAVSGDKRIVYPHLATGRGRVVAELDDYPRMARYLEQHRGRLAGRAYVREAGRRWYELWVPHDPAAWARPKLVFRDICDRPTFWLDESGAVVNGDCYWLCCEQPAEEEWLWLALGVCNSSFIETYYDLTFNNRLYGGRRRFMSQYVEAFPLPRADSDLGLRIAALARQRYGMGAESAAAAEIEAEVDQLVWQAFGFAGVGDGPG
ncbi:MAG: N-6 DNA methylase [Deltaproteobacteria bacterium]|nr:N-6 DNA methylase [Deltaproteobacteria bacterium]